MKSELAKRDKCIADAQNKNTDDLKIFKDELYAEMENRFALLLLNYLCLLNS